MVRAAYGAARRLQRDFGEVVALQASPKGSENFVLESRRRATATLKESLTKARPALAWLSADHGDKPGRWLVDAISGNRNFAHGLPFFAITIALQLKDEVTAAVVYDPLRDEMFRASRGDGAYCNDRRLRVSARQELAEALIGADSITPLRDEQEAAKTVDNQRRRASVAAATGGTRELGCAALDLAYVAAGRLDGFWSARAGVAGRAAGALLVREAGGFATAADGVTDPLAGAGMLAANNHLHATLGALIHSAAPVVPAA
jgi:myo-inositol-1(or 4)-monophosphatase